MPADTRTCQARVAYVMINGTGLGLCWGAWFGPMDPTAAQRLSLGSNVAVRALGNLRSSIAGTSLAFAGVFGCYQAILCGAERHFGRWQSGALAGGVVGLGIGLSALPMVPIAPAKLLTCAASYAIPFAAVSTGFQLYTGPPSGSRS